MLLLKPSRLATAELMREFDRYTIEELGLPGMVLMENAARGVVDEILKEYFWARRVSIFCGKGNNGGDGFAIARYLFNYGIELEVFLIGKKQELKGDARLNLELFEKLGGSIFELVEEEKLSEIEEFVTESDLIVDAIFGTGLSSDLKGIQRRVVEFINLISIEFGIPVISVDLPSGVNADTGEIMGVAIEADKTVTFGLAKLGHFIYPGAECTGELKLVDIGIPSFLFEKVPYQLLDKEFASLLVKPRFPASHKGDFGHLIVIAGSVGKTGAASMTAESALRAGAGLVTLAVPEPLNDIFEVKLTEVMTEPIPCSKEKKMFDKSSIPYLKKLMENKSAIAIGPGLGLGEELSEMVEEILLYSEIPVVIDADGLNALAGKTDVLKKVKAPVVLTPHPGEMSRLTGISTKEIQRDRVKTALSFSKEWGVILVLKGARTVIAEPGGKAWINITGNPGMASAGMGDVLTGIIAGFLSQGYSSLDSALLGVYLHGRAGDMAGEELGEAGILAGDLFKRIPLARRELERVFEDIDEEEVEE